MFGLNEDMMWFFAVFIFTIAPVMRFRENYLVPLLATLMVFGFYTQAFWMPDFYNLNDWPWIGLICGLILLAYFICGFFIHYPWLKYKSAYLADYGPFGPLFKTWITGKHYIIDDQFVMEINRFRLFEVKWPDIVKIESEKGEKGQIILRLYDGISREKEEMNMLMISDLDNDFNAFTHKLQEKHPSLLTDWQKSAGEARVLFHKEEAE